MRFLIPANEWSVQQKPTAIAQSTDRFRRRRRTAAHGRSEKSAKDRFATPSQAITLRGRNQIADLHEAL
jgi:hypothetical protein